ncbi:MAG: hypothetical protein DCC75_03590 [Proteobacteria bacterium]|nr:MAG: hypothetical protein DCC75_03590 [Pseudomonadota bacterium]
MYRALGIDVVFEVSGYLELSQVSASGSYCLDNYNLTARDNVWDEVHTAREQAQADVVILFTAVSRYCGAGAYGVNDGKNPGVPMFMVGFRCSAAELLHSSGRLFGANFSKPKYANRINAVKGQIAILRPLPKIIEIKSIMLDDRIQISGRVVTQDGTPVPDDAVQLLHQSQIDQAYYYVRYAYTDAQGYFSIEARGRGKYRLAYPLERNPEIVSDEISYPSGHELTVRVEEIDGKPLFRAKLLKPDGSAWANEQLRLQFNVGTQSWNFLTFYDQGWSTLTDSSGEATLGPLATSDWKSEGRFRVEHQGREMVNTAPIFSNEVEYRGGSLESISFSQDTNRKVQAVIYGTVKNRNERSAEGAMIELWGPHGSQGNPARLAEQQTTVSGGVQFVTTVAGEFYLRNVSTGKVSDSIIVRDLTDSPNEPSPPSGGAPGDDGDNPPGGGEGNGDDLRSIRNSCRSATPEEIRNRRKKIQRCIKRQMRKIVG